MNYVIGIDGGGTKTKAVLMGVDRKVYASVKGDSTNYQTIGKEQASRTIMELIDCLLDEARVVSTSVLAVCCCLSGIDSSKDNEMMLASLRKLSIETNPILSERIHLYNDGVAALYSIDGTGDGAIIVAGTGCVAVGKDSSRHFLRVGGWGHIIGDLGSGFDIGRNAIIAVVAASEGIAKKTTLTASILEKVKLKNENELIAWSNNPNRTPKDFAALVPIVVECANMQDNVAKHILFNAAEEIGKLLVELLNKGNWNSKRVSLVGGLANIWDWLKEPLKQKVEHDHPDVEWVKPKFSPVIGAAFLALEKCEEGDVS